MLSYPNLKNCYLNYFAPLLDYFAPENDTITPTM